MVEKGNTAPPATGARKSRIGARLKGRANVECRVGVMGSSSNIAERLLNISESGAELVVTEKVASGRRVELKLTGPESWQPVVMLAKVARCAASTDDPGKFQLGVKFDERIGDELLRNLAFAK